MKLTVGRMYGVANPNVSEPGTVRQFKYKGLSEDGDECEGLRDFYQDFEDGDGYGVLLTDVDVERYVAPYNEE